MDLLNNLEITTYKPSTENEIVELLEYTFDHWPDRDIQCSKQDHWKWKYLDTPLKKYNIILAKVNDILVGCDHAYFLKLKMGDRTLLVSHGTDAAVHPEYQGRGIYTKMAELKKVEYDKDEPNLSFWIADNPIFIISGLRKGRPTLPYPLVNMLRIRDVKLHLSKTKSTNKLVKEIGYYVFNLYASLTKVFSRNIRRITPFSIIEVEEFDERIDLFWEEIKKHYHFIVERTRGYLNYRYHDIRAGRYRVTIAEDANGILGYAAIMINRVREYPTGNIIDLLCLPGRIDVADALVKDAIAYFDNEEVNVIRFWILKNHPLMSILKRRGFLESDHKAPALFFSLYNVGYEWDIFQKSPVDKIHIQMADTEWM